MNKPKVAFLCVHNSCRSQIAEALGKYYAADVFESYSAGTEAVQTINQDAIKLMKQNYNIDMEKTQCSKHYQDIPPVDIVVTMGCNVQCPQLRCNQREDWGLEDPSGKSAGELQKAVHMIERKILELKKRIEDGI